jgi:hypothetical protein
MRDRQDAGEAAKEETMMLAIMNMILALSRPAV